MKAVILAGGLGTRIVEESHLRPKPMIEIGGMPILWHIMKLYAHHGVTDFVVCCGYKGGWLALWRAELGAEVHGYALEPPTTPNLSALRLYESGRASSGPRGRTGDGLELRPGSGRRLAGGTGRAPAVRTHSGMLAVRSRSGAARIGAPRSRQHSGAHPARLAVVAEVGSGLPGFIVQRPLSDLGVAYVNGAIGSLHRGELEAMVLAREQKIDQVAMDDRSGLATIRTIRRL